MRERSQSVSGGAETPRRRRDAPADSDTIVAISTPRGKGGIGVIRLSGDRAVTIADGLFRPVGPGSNGPGTAVFGRFVRRGGEAIDEGYRVVFLPPRSFTGEETVELWAHGSPAVLRRLVEDAVELGARPATPGEFTLRAFLSGRIDAPQAEAICDLIEARTVYQARVAHEQATGRLSARINGLKERLAEIVAGLEASIEFSEEEDAGRFLPGGGVLPAIDALRRDMVDLAGSYERGRRVREGAAVALIGAVNVGKSSLFNRLLEEERAIVTPIAGTTRDRIEETLDLDGIPVALIDTAGLHAPRDEADAEAMRRSRDAIDSADLRLLVLDRSRALGAEEEALLKGERMAPMLIVVNKCDLPAVLDVKRIGMAGGGDVIEVSARDGDGIDALRERIAAEVGGGRAASGEQLFLTNVRHRDLLLQAADALAGCERAVRDRLGEECLVVDLREGLDRLGEISGEVGIEGIYDRIFSRFCIGK